MSTTDKVHLLKVSADPWTLSRQLSTDAPQCCEAGFACFKRLGRALIHNTTVTDLDLGNNAGRDKGVEDLAHELLVNAGLLSLDLTDNNVGLVGAEALAALAIRTESLTSLCLRANRLGDAGARAMAGAVGSSAMLRHLDLGGNGIGDAGAGHLADALRMVPPEGAAALRTLTLDNNHIGDDGAARFAVALKHNRSLQTLSLRCNRIQEKGEGWLAHATGGANLTRTVLLRTFDATKSFRFQSDVDALAAQVSGPGGSDAQQLDDHLWTEEHPLTSY